MKARWFAYLGTLAIAVALAGCPKSRSHGGACDGGEGCDGGAALVDGSTPEALDGGAASSDGGEQNQDSDASAPVLGCGAREITKADLLFVVDNSGTMREEQMALRAELPKLIETLTSGKRFDGDPNPFQAVEDLHLAVVSTDMGLANVDGIIGCEGLGEDGVMRDPRQMGCSSDDTGGRFLSYRPSEQSPAEIATAFGCLADLGTDGCGFEQQLESSLKALWPAADQSIPFVTTADGLGAEPHGDRENKGFLREDSLLGIVLVTDENDCSSADTSHFTPMASLNPTDPNYNVDLNLRCFRNKQNLYGPVAGDPNKMARYVKGYKALREGNENLVIFGAIAGVPPDLVTAAERAKYDFSNEVSRNSYYDRILTDQRMVEKEDPTREPGKGNLIPSCDTATGLAYPPVRIVQTAKEFGENAVVQSICQDDFGPAMDAIIEVIAKQLGAVCLPRPLVRQSTGKVGCEVVWELPPPGMALDTTPTDCGGTRPWLQVPTEGLDATNDRKGKNCVVKQLPVNEDTKQIIPEDGIDQGWYYDNFTDELKKSCSPSTPQRVAFTANAKPPTGVTVKLECLNETQTVANTDPNVVTTIQQPSIGTPCAEDAMGDPIPVEQRNAKCAVQLKDGTANTSMICHPEQRVCVRTCKGDPDCPPAWVCDDRAETIGITGQAICVNPTCGTNK